MAIEKETDFANNPETTQSLLKIFSAASITDKTILYLMAVNLYPLRQKHILAGLREIAPPADRDMGSGRLRERLIEFEANGLIEKNENGYQCVSAIRCEILLDLIDNNGLDVVGKVLRTILPFSRQAVPLDDPKELYFRDVRDLLLELFSGSGALTIEDGLDDLYENHSQEFIRHPPLSLIFPRPYLVKLASLTKRDTQAYILNLQLMNLSHNLEPAEDVIRHILDNRLAEATDPVYLASGLANYGRCKEVAKLLKQAVARPENDFKISSLQARCDFMHGNIDPALAGFLDSFKKYRQLKASKGHFLPENEDSLFFLAAALLSKQPKYFQEALKYLKPALKQQSMYQAQYEGFFVLFMELTGQPLHFDTFDPLTKVAAGPIAFLFQLFLIKRLRPEMLPDMKTAVSNLKALAAAGGFAWLEAEAAALLANLAEQPEVNLAQAEKIHRQHGTISLVNYFASRPRWEKIITTLERLSNKNAAGNRPAAGNQRLIWLFEYVHGCHFANLSPRVQKSNKSGSWTKGRAASLKTLYHEGDQLDFLTSQDRSVITAIKERHHYPYENEYELDIDRALRLLIGHPLIFLDYNPDIQVELVPGKPEISIERIPDNGIEVNIYPQVDFNTPPIMVVEETPTRYQVIENNETLEQLYDIIGDGIELPPEAEKPFLENISRLADQVTVHSDSTCELDIREVAGDPRPHVHLLPFREGLMVEFRVQPLTDGEHSFSPGEGGAKVMGRIADEQVIARRDLEAERLNTDRVIKGCPTLTANDNLNLEWRIDDPVTALEILLELQSLKDQQDFFLKWPQGEKIKVHREFSGRDFKLDIRSEKDWFKAEGALRVNETLTLNLRQLLEAMSQARGRFLPLDDHCFIALSKRLKQQIQEMADVSETRGDGLRLAPLTRLAFDDFENEFADFSADQAWRDLGKRLDGTIEPRLPSTLQACLRDYQVEGFNWLAQLSHWQVGACLADDMGLGKTLQALAVILTRAARGPSLVVAPLSVIANWEEECRRFAPTLNPVVFGAGDRREMLENLGSYDLLIVSYGLLQIEAENFAAVKWQTAILDEAQAIKNFNTKRTQAAMKIRAEFKMITTGTPVENHLGELWTLFNFINPGLLGGQKWFQRNFVLPSEKNQSQEKYRSLKKLIRPFILRRLKSDVLQELPSKTEITLKVEMSPEEASLYEAQRLNSLARLADENALTPKHLQVLVEIMKLRRLCCNPRLLLPESGIPGSKLKVFAETVDELRQNNHKALVFSQFVDHLSLIREYLDEAGISYQYLDGSTPAKKRRESIDAFQNGDGDLFLISLKAGGSGLNLTAADYVIHMDPWWNPAVENQASDRAHRIGQTRPVTVYRIIAKNTIEEQIVDLHQRKRELAEQILDGSDATGKLDAEELLNLLKKQPVERRTGGDLPAKGAGASSAGGRNR
ncbi:MAG: ATP-dependent helicase [Deltaproteobacteria bacterium]|nr:ATP-dependent helicase [Deltaproteobacteria bacterium]